MNRLTRLFCIAAVLGCTFVLPAQAQTRTPDTGLIGVGADIGVLFPDEDFENAFTIDGYGEWYLTPRVSLRGLLAWSSPGFDGRTEDHFRQVKLLFNGVYNWEMGTWHPFVTGGAGFYFVRQHFEDDDDPDGETRGGLNFGGGVEYFTGRRSSIKGELRWDIVSDPPGLPDASGASLTIGYKIYF